MSLTDHALAGAALAVIAVLLGAIGYGATTATFDKLAELRGWKETNKRGYVRCVDGVLEVGNIDFYNLSAYPRFSFENNCGGGQWNVAPLSLRGELRTPDSLRSE